MKADEVKKYKSDEVVSIVDGRFARPDIVLYSDFLAFAKEAEERAEKSERAKFGTPCRCESWIEACRIAEERAETLQSRLDEAVEAVLDMHDDLFSQCCSNPIFNTWGRQVDMTKINKVYEIAYSISKAKAVKG
jgi:hypothetical protein